MDVKKRDSRGNILRLGESQSEDGTYLYSWIDEDGETRVNHAETLEELRRDIMQIHQYLHHEIPTSAMAMTLDELYRMWIDEKKGILKERTFQRYTGMYEHQISYILGNRRIYEIRGADIRHYCEKLIQEHGLQERSARNYFRLIYQILQYGVREGYLPYNPAKRAYRGNIYKKDSQTKKRKALTIREQQLILELLESVPELRRYRPVIQVMLFTGLRVGEVKALQWEDIDFDRKILYVRHTLGKKQIERDSGHPADTEANPNKRKIQRNRYRKSLTQPKTNSSVREIPLLKKAEEALKEEQAWQRKRRIISREKIDGYENFVFLMDGGRLLRDRVLNEALRESCARLREKDASLFQDLSKVTCHTLRHTFATRLCEAGVQMKVIQDVMGHADISLTMDVYAEATADQILSEIYRLGDRE